MPVTAVVAPAAAAPAATADPGSAERPELVDLERALFRVVRTLAQLRPPTGVTARRAALPLLMILRDAGQLRASTLACALGLDLSTVSRHLRHLAEGGLVTRSPDPVDGRAARLRVTRRGARVVDAVRDGRRRVLAGALTGWSEAEQAALRGQLARLAEALGPDPLHGLAGRETEPGPTDRPTSGCPAEQGSDATGSDR